jgi:hypothetical protein
MSQRAWMLFAAASWPVLVAGGRVCAPPELPHPSVSGFVRPRMTEDCGQADDWAIALSDGSRLHVHEYAAGPLVVHRDKVDPGSGTLRALWHVATETCVGGAVVRIGAIAATVLLIGRLAR